MIKLKKICTVALCALLTVQSVEVGAAIINGSGSHAVIKKANYEYREGDYTEEEEREYSNTETTIITTRTEEWNDTNSTITHEEIGPADIVFTIDSTGSMYPYIQNVQNNVEAFAEYLEAKGVPARMAVMEYRDITYDGDDSTKIHMIDGTTWHKTTAELKKTLDIVKNGVDGGGDDPETLVDALGFVSNGSLLFRSDAHKFVIVLTDADYKEDNRYGLTMESVTEELKSQNIHSSVITREEYYGLYEDLVDETGVLADIDSESFSEELKKLADTMVQTITEEVIDSNKVSVESVQVTSKGDSAIKVGNSVDLEATILPEDAVDKTVVWNVNEEGIVDMEISDDTRTCTVTGRKKGSVVIVAATEDGGFGGEYNVKVIGGSSSDEGDPAGGGDILPASLITLDDLKVTPAKKNIAKGRTFKIKVSLQLDDPDLTEEDLEELKEDNIDGIEYRSTKTSVATVNKTTGAIKARKKGKAVIKTTIHLVDGESRTFKTTVRVK